MKRWEQVALLLQGRPHAVGAEIGVKEGNTSIYLLRTLPELQTLYCIDPWLHYKDYNSDKAGRDIPWPNQAMLDTCMAQFFNRLDLNKFWGRVRILRMLSLHAAHKVPRNSLNFAFMDANHAYEYVAQDLKLWWPRIKVGGVLIGHDYNRWPKHWGVKKAVNEFFRKGNPATPTAGKVQLGEDWCWWVEKGEEDGEEETE